MCFRTQASASEKVGFVLRYQAVCRTRQAVFSLRVCANSVTRANKANTKGVLRAMAWSFHCRWVSIPRWARASSKVVSTVQRWMKKVSICWGVMVGSVLSKAWGGNRPLGSLTKSQRMGTGGNPE